MCSFYLKIAEEVITCKGRRGIREMKTQENGGGMEACEKKKNKKGFNREDT